MKINIFLLPNLLLTVGAIVTCGEIEQRYADVCDCDSSFDNNRPFIIPHNPNAVPTFKGRHAEGTASFDAALLAFNTAFLPGVFNDFHSTWDANSYTITMCLLGFTQQIICSLDYESDWSKRKISGCTFGNIPLFGEIIQTLHSQDWISAPVIVTNEVSVTVPVLQRLPFFDKPIDEFYEPYELNCLFDF